MIRTAIPGAPNRPGALDVAISSGSERGTILVNNVSKEYSLSNGTRRRCLSDVSLHIPSGHFACIVGPSGCGKSTLLGIVSGICAPTQGTASVGGEPVNGLMPNVGYIFQHDLLLPWKTVADNVGLALRLRGTAKAERKKRTAEWLERIGLAPFANYYPHQLSGGMKKRVAVAQGLIHEPAVLLLDEPFSALDAFGRDAIEDDLMEFFRQLGCTAVFVTHDIQEAIALADDVFVMTRSGTIKACVTIDLPRPRTMAEVRSTPAASAAYERIWGLLKEEVQGL